ncbi:MAG: type II toxin-antitoxin system Phd/YefM family antitoxin [Geminicoccaceae bacterium]
MQKPDKTAILSKTAVLESVMTLKTVTSTEFRARAGQYLDEAAKAPVIITKHNRPARVLIDIEEYDRLQKQSERKARLAAIAREDHARFGPLYEKLAK